MAVRSMDLAVIRVIPLVHRLVVDPVLRVVGAEVTSVMVGCAPTAANCVHM